MNPGTFLLNPGISILNPGEEEFFIANLLVRIHYIIVMIKWTGLAPWEFEFPFPGSLTSTFLVNPGISILNTGTSILIVLHLPTQKG